MLESLNTFILKVLDLLLLQDHSLIFFIVNYSALLIVVWLEIKALYAKDKDTDSEGICFGLFLIHLSFNVYYSFFCLPDHFIFLTNIVVFLSPYFILYLLYHYLSKFKK